MWEWVPRGDEGTVDSNHFTGPVPVDKAGPDLSPSRSILEYMFDRLPGEPETLSHADDAAVVAAIEEWARLEAAAGARRLAAIAELTTRRCDKQGKRAQWACDGWDSVAAEVACALGVRHNKASSQMTLSLTLRHRLPKVAALYGEGKVGYRVVSAIAWHTGLVTAGQPIAAIDAALANQAAKWGKLSDYKLAQAIDFWVDLHDPGALRRIHSRTLDRCLEVGREHDSCDITTVWGRLFATDAAVLDRRLMELAHGVCDDDPRTIAQRRADALGALAAGAQRLACSCDNPDCASGGNDGRASNVVIHVVTEVGALDAARDPQMSGEIQTTRRAVTPQRDLDAPSGAQQTPPAGLLLRGGMVPAPLLAELIASGATVQQVRHPRDAPEPGYRPSAKLEEFIRVRDLTCRFPGCEEPAEFCDIDHTIPYPIGPTHPSNLKCTCRKHHLLKTFWTGIGGWADRQLPDGTVIWKAPTGITYKTLPGSRLFFPNWDTTTAELPPPRKTAVQTSNRGIMMPRRRRTRATDRARRIKEERELNAAQRAAWARQAAQAQAKAQAAQRNKPPPPERPNYWDIQRGSTDDGPPPF